MIVSAVEESEVPLLRMRAVEKSFAQNKVLRGIDLDVRRGEVVTIIGPSGSGKTTLLRCVNVLETYDGGSITIDGTEVGFRDPRARRRRSDRELAPIRAETGMVFQMFNLFPHLTAAQNIMLGLTKVRRKSKAEARAVAEHWLKRVGLSDKIDHLPSQLSGGQQQRVGIARAVAMDPKLLLLDEITSALDPELVGEVLEVVGGLASDGMTMLVVTHEMGFARDVSSKVVFMDGGVVAEEGPPSAVLLAPQQERLRNFLARFASGSLPAVNRASS
jgi:polar amino acid transport system ATP-binding protein